MGSVGTPLRILLGPFSGVPIFFLISGFLVSASFERNPAVRRYLRNRAVRIYPALWVCLLVTVLILGIGGYLRSALHGPSFASWLLAQATFAQFVHLRAFRGFGTGVPNGSLWTIPVELGFYLCVPILYFLFLRDRRLKSTFLLVALAALSSTLAALMAIRDPNNLHTATKLLAETPLPYGDLFLLGILSQRHFVALSRIFVGKVLWWSIAFYSITAIIPAHPCTVALGWCPVQESPRDASLVTLSHILLAGLVFSIAFSVPTLSNRLLRGHDVSYGVYLFHMLLVNLAVAAGLAGRPWLVPVLLMASLLVGWISWQLVELPSLTRWKSGASRSRIVTSRSHRPRTSTT
jgi:peptidoglycan/LPS O-acetylase OafA/YrhL